MSLAELSNFFFFEFNILRISIFHRSLAFYRSVVRQALCQSFSFFLFFFRKSDLLVLGANPAGRVTSCGKSELGDNEGNATAAKYMVTLDYFYGIRRPDWSGPKATQVLLWQLCRTTRQHNDYSIATLSICR